MAYGTKLRNAVTNAATFRPAPAAPLQTTAAGHVNTVARQAYVLLCPSTGNMLATIGRGPAGWWHQPVGGQAQGAPGLPGQPFATSAAAARHYHGAAFAAKRCNCGHYAK